MRTMRRKNRTKRQYRKSFTKRGTKRTKRTKRTKKSSKSKDDLKRFKKLQKKLEKLFMNNASKKEIDKTSKQLADLQKKMIKANKKRMKGGMQPEGHYIKLNPGEIAAIKSLKGAPLFTRTLPRAAGTARHLAWQAAPAPAPTPQAGSATPDDASSGGKGGQ